MKGDKVIKHGSFGAVTLTKVHGNSGFMLGSEIESPTYIELKISRSELIRNNSGIVPMERVFPEENIVTVKMTNAQFAELITTINNGSGVPCTIDTINNTKVAQISPGEMESTLSYSKSRYMEYVDNIRKCILTNNAKLKKILSKPNISEKDKKEMLELNRMIVQNFNSNMPFVLKCFRKNVEKIEIKTKEEIESFIDISLKKNGLDSKDLKLLGDEKK